jgi:hypothetical protein
LIPKHETPFRPPSSAAPRRIARAHRPLTPLRAAARAQNCITGLSTCPEWGGSQQCTQFTSGGLDGRMCFWTVPAV